LRKTSHTIIANSITYLTWHSFARLGLLVDAVGLGAICRRDILSLADKDRVLATSACSNDLLAANGGVINNGGGVDVVDCALAGLVVAGEAPGEDLAFGVDGEVVVSASGDGDNVLGIWSV
jgi:hypothetical protein